MYVCIYILQYARISTLGLAFVLRKSYQFNKPNCTDDNPRESSHEPIVLRSMPTYIYSTLFNYEIYIICFFITLKI